ncbi:hypothetical protein Lser_V15G29705 [Lactuca serriola]
MVKSEISKKQSKTSASVQPTGSDSATRNQSPSISSSNFRAVFDDHPFHNELIRIMIKFISNHPLFGAFDSFIDVVPLSTLFKCAFSAYRPLNNLQEVHLNLVDDSLVILNKDKFLTAINLLVHPSTKFFLPSVTDIPLEFERLNRFHVKHGSSIEKIWSNDRPSAVKNFKSQKFMKADFIQYTLTRRNQDYVRTQADFPCMNPEEIFLIARVFQNKSEKNPKMKIALERASTFLRETICDFARIDTNIHTALAPKFNLPPLDPAPMLTKGFQERSLGATNFPDLGVIFKCKNNEIKYFIPMTSMHRLTRKQIELNLIAVQNSKHTTAEVKFEISKRITWLGEVRKFWWILIKFLKLEK